MSVSNDRWHKWSDQSISCQCRRSRTSRENAQRSLFRAQFDTGACFAQVSRWLSWSMSPLSLSLCCGHQPPSMAQWPLTRRPNAVTYFQGAASSDRGATEWALLDEAVAASIPSLSSPSPHNRQLALRLINYHTLRYCRYTNRGCTAQMPTATGPNSSATPATMTTTTLPQPPVTNGTFAAWANATGYGKLGASARSWYFTT